MPADTSRMMSVSMRTSSLAPAYSSNKALTWSSSGFVNVRTDNVEFVNSTNELYRPRDRQRTYGEYVGIMCLTATSSNSSRTDLMPLRGSFGHERLVSKPKIPR